MRSKDFFVLRILSEFTLCLFFLYKKQIEIQIMIFRVTRAISSFNYIITSDVSMLVLIKIVVMLSTL